MDRPTALSRNNADVSVASFSPTTAYSPKIVAAVGLLYRYSNIRNFVATAAVAANVSVQQVKNCCSSGMFSLFCSYSSIGCCIEYFQCYSIYFQHILQFSIYYIIQHIQLYTSSDTAVITTNQ